MDIVGGYVAFTEVGAGAHHSYNRWHLFDHLPEQFRLDGVAWGRRWVLEPPARLAAVLRPPLDRVHYVTLYLFTEPFAETVTAFRALGGQLREQDRFHRERTAHLSGPLRVSGRRTAVGVDIDPRAVPFAPHRSVRIALDGVANGSDDPPMAAEGAVGTWWFTGLETLAPRRLVVTWRDDPAPGTAAGGADPSAAFDAVLASIDPYGSFDWFDG